MISQTQEQQSSSIFDHSRNNFDLVRLLAALVVIYAHSGTFTKNGYEWVAAMTGVTYAGELSVVIFFFISGALIMKSLSGSRSIKIFFLKRILRIYPALTVCCLLVAYGMTLAFSERGLIGTLRSRETFNYFLSNSIGVWNIHTISGVLEGRNSSALNGSLWSITLELRLYLFLGLLGMVGVMRNTLAQTLVLAGSIIVLAISPQNSPLIGDSHALYGATGFSTFSIIFLLGGIFFILEKKIEFNYGAAVVIAGLLLAMARGTEIYRPAIFAFTIAVALYVATLPGVVTRLRLRHDYSYGAYLYGWPCQQLSYHLLFDGVQQPAAWKVTVLAIPMALACAALSWKFVERPCMNLAKRKSFGGRPADQSGSGT